MSVKDKGGFGLDFAAMSLRFADECLSRGVTGRADFITKWNAATAAQKMAFLARVLFGSARFPDDARNATPFQLASSNTVPP